jgi:hypothetical protein
MRRPDRTISNVGEFVAELRKDKSNNSPIWCRGQADASWKLIPSIGRNPKHIEAELTIIKIFKQSSRPYLLERPNTEWEWISLMQHHRAPTRLLDWTERPLVALYFVVSEEPCDPGDGALWMLDPVALNRQAGHRRAFDQDVLAFDVDEALGQYLPDQVNARKVDLDPVAAIGPRNSPRMVAQAGTFTIMHAQPRPVEEVGDGEHVWRFIVPSAFKQPLREELELLGVTKSALFPDLDQVAEVARKLLR